MKNAVNCSVTHVKTVRQLQRELLKLIDDVIAGNISLEKANVVNKLAGNVNQMFRHADETFSE